VKVRQFPVRANSRAAIWSVIFKVLHFPVIDFFVVRHFRVLQIQRPPGMKISSIESSNASI